MKLRLLLACGCFVAATAAFAKVTVPDILGDNMVLQQQTDVKFWGTANPGKNVVITPSWSKEKVAVKAGSDGKWVAKVRTPKGSHNPQTIKISDGEALTLKNVLIGEVWLASGQSNMEMPLGGFYNCPVENANETILESGKYRNSIRFVRIPWVHSLVPQDTVDCHWVESAPENAPRFSAAAYYFAESVANTLDVPVGIIDCNWGGSPIESWMSRDVLAKKYPDVDLNNDNIIKRNDWGHSPTVMYNAMIHPLINFTLKGFIWYQGEANIYGHASYAQRMADMVNLWRNDWGLGEMPFYFVEIAPFNYGEDLSPYLREAQFKAQSLIPHSGMVCTNDLVLDYEDVNIHPAMKKEVGMRLGFFALANDYGVKGIKTHGPEFKAVEFKDGKARVTFNYAESGYNRMKDITGFEISGADKKFYPAKAWFDNGAIVVSSDSVAAPVAVRYCYRDFLKGNLAGTYGLPVVPFRTDNWEWRK